MQKNNAIHKKKLGIQNGFDRHYDKIEKLFYCFCNNYLEIIIARNVIDTPIVTRYYLIMKTSAIRLRGQTEILDFILEVFEFHF